MRTKPIIFNILALFFLGIAISFPLQIAYLYENDLFHWEDWKSIMIKMTPLNYAVVFISLTNSILNFKVSPLIKYTLPIGIFITAINNYFVGVWGHDFNLLQTSLATLGLTIVSYSFVFTSSYSLLKNPRSQWWKIPIRYKQSLPVWIESNNKTRVLTSTFDISKTGTFLSDMNQYTKNLMEELNIGEHINLYISTQKGDLKIQGIVVRKEFRTKGNYPTGMGVQFSTLGILERFKLRGLLTNYGVS
jgi:hypothetical protein